MALAMLLPSVFPKWFTPSGDAVLSGGSLEFYEVGTTTPKSVYADYQRNAAIGSVVTLDGAGDATIFLGDGGYKVILKDALGAQLDLVDGVFGSGNVFSVDSTASFAFLKTYDEVRALTRTADVIYVCGRETEADGGEGLFQLRPNVTAHDDDGIFLSSVGGSVEYRRVFDAAIDPRWYGVKYGVSDDQKARLEACFPGSAETGMPVLVAKQITVTQNVTVPNAAVIECLHDGFFYAANSVSMTFEAGSRFSGVETCFQGGIQPTFAAGTIEELRLSWFYGADSTTWARALASTTAKVALRMDKSTLVTSGVAIPASLTLEPENGAVLTFAALADLSIGSLGDVGFRQFLAYGSDAYVGAVSIASPVCYMEWFGGGPSNSGNANAIPFRACCAARRLDLQAGPLNYTVTNTNPFTVSDFVTWVGNGSKITLNQDVTFLGVYLNDITVFGSGSITHNSCVATKVVSIIPLLNGPTSAVDSILSDVAWLTKAQNSQLSNPGSIEGQIAACSISSNASIQIKAPLWADGCTIQSTSVAPVFVFADDVAESTFVGCIVEAASTFMYSANASLVVMIQGCQNPDWSNGQAIHNGIATVNVIASGVRGNSTATTNDGHKCKIVSTISGAAFEFPMEIAAPAFGVTDPSNSTGWHGVGSFSFVGQYMVLGSSVALDSTPWGLNTIRYAGINSDGSGTMKPGLDKVWRYGGQLMVDVEYPAGSPPDPESRLCFAMVCPRISGNYTNQDMLTDHHIFGETTAINLPAKNGAKIANFANIWGGQVTLRVPDDTGYIISDEWGDVSTGTPVLGPGVIYGIPRIVIYDKGNKITPAGTKIRLYLGAYMPTTEQYSKYWPDTPFEFVFGTASQSVRPEPTYIREESPYYIRAAGGLIRTPYVFRSGDANGVQIARARVNRNAGSGYPTPSDLPVTVWANGTTINGSYS